MWEVQEGRPPTWFRPSRGHSPWCRDCDDECSSTNKCGHSHGHDSSFDDRKVKQRRGTSASPLHGQRQAHTPECRPLPPPPMLHSTPLAISLKPASVESVPARLSFDRSQCSLPPLDLGEEDARSLPFMGVPTLAATSSLAGPIPQTSTPASALQLTEDHTKTIFNLGCEGRHLKERIAQDSLNFPAGRSCSTLRPSPPVTRRWPVCVPNIFLPFTKYFGPMRSLLTSVTRPWRKLSMRRTRHGHRPTRLYSNMFLTTRESWTRS